ncbi:hypothetical protein MMSP_2324 [Mycobacterium sp. 012931]|nr:hypothetical protein MMSP_2324 [Mycobacterium sp. 012931]
MQQSVSESAQRHLAGLQPPMAPPSLATAQEAPQLQTLVPSALFDSR